MPIRQLDTLALNAEQRDEFRKMLAASLQLARTYDGTEHTFNHLIDITSRLDQWMRDVFGKGTAIGDVKEVEVAHVAGSKRGHNISQILDMAQAQLERCMARAKTFEELMRELNIVFTIIDGIFLPTIPKPIEVGDGQFESAVRTEPRLERLVAGLQSHGIYTDDLLITRGGVGPSQMRKHPYVLVEIPRIGREALVCNQVGEATFVSRRHLFLQTYLITPKEELATIKGITRILCKRGLEQWVTDVIYELLLDLKTEGMNKVDVRDVEALRREIQRRIPTGSEWAKMSGEERHALKVSGIGEDAIATKLGVDHEKSPCHFPYYHLLVGAAIYGENEPTIQAALKQEQEWQEMMNNTDKLKAKVKEGIPTGKKWIEMSRRQRMNFKVAGRGEWPIATALGISCSENPSACPYAHALLGNAIYGDDPVIQASLKQEKDWEELRKQPEQLKIRVREIIPSADKWMLLQQKERLSLKIAGRGEIAIGKALGISLEQDPCHYLYPHVLIGSAIYGANIPVIQAAIKIEEEWQDLEKDPAKLKARIKEKYPTGKGWIAMTHQQKTKFQIAERGERAISSALGLSLEKNPCGYLFSHAQLGSKIYGEDDPAIQAVIKEESAWQDLEKDPEKLIAKIRESIPTAKKWVEMSKDEKSKLRIAGRGIVAVASAIFGSSCGNPCSNPNVYLLLGAKIYGENEPEIQSAFQKEKEWEELTKDPNKLKAKVRESIPTGAEWIAMKTDEKHNFKILGRGEMAIARALEISLSQNPLGRTYPHLQLGAEIYGKSDPAITAALSEQQIT